MIWLILFPLFFTAFILLYTLILFTKGNTEAYSLCYKAGAEIQEGLKPQLQNLLKLNSAVSRLKKEKSFAEKVHKAALIVGEPLAISAASKYLKLVKARQNFVYFKQKAIFAKSSFHIEKTFKKFYPRQLSFLTHIRKRKPKYPLAVKKDFPKDRHSEYSLDQPFTEKQKIKILWKMNFLRSAPSILKKELGEGEAAGHHCSVSLEKQEMKDEEKGANGFRVRLIF